MVCQAIFDGLKVLGPFLTSEYRPSYPVALYLAKEGIGKYDFVDFLKVAW